ncbi:RecX family transcriptional regulator [bacterium]|nr:RecX family transcriptional regulator [bacterium]
MADLCTITKVEPQKKRKDRLNIYIDGAFAFGVRNDVALEYKIFRGRELTEEELSEIKRAEEFSGAKEKGFLLLSYRARSISEFKSRLKQSRYSPEIVDAVTEEFINKGYLNDKEFAKSFVISRMVTKPASKSYIINELIRHNIDTETAQNAVEISYGDLHEREVAASLVKKKSKHYSKDNEKDKKRLFDFLRRRGFSFEIIKDVVENEWQ